MDCMIDLGGGGGISTNYWHANGNTCALCGRVYLSFQR